MIENKTILTLQVGNSNKNNLLGEEVMKLAGILNYVLLGKLKGNRELQLSFPALDDDQAKSIARSFIECHASDIEDEFVLSRSEPIAKIWNDFGDDKIIVSGP